MVARSRPCDDVREFEEENLLVGPGVTSTKTASVRVPSEKRSDFQVLTVADADYN